MSTPTHIQYEQEVGVAIEDACLESMLEAGAEEKRLAILARDVDRGGIPLLTVLADGIWGKRSYKVKYNSSVRKGEFWFDIHCKFLRLHFIPFVLYLSSSSRAERQRSVAQGTQHNVTYPQQSSCRLARLGARSFGLASLSLRCRQVCCRSLLGGRTVAEK